MIELHHVYVILYAIAAALALIVAVVVWRRRSARGALSLAAMMFGISIWSFTLAMEWYVPTLSEQAFWLAMGGLGKWICPVAFLTLAFNLSGRRRWLAFGRIVPISIVAFIFANIEWLNPSQLFYRTFVATTMGPYTHYVAVRGPLYWASAAFVYTLILIASIIIFRVHSRTSGSERTQAAILLGGGVLPLVIDIVGHILFGSLNGLELAPFAFLGTGALWLIALQRGALFNILPMARDALVEQMSDGVMVLDGEGLVVDANPAACTILHIPLAQMIGGPAIVALEGMRGSLDLLHGSGRRRSVLSLGDGDDPRFVEMEVTPLAVDPGQPPANLVTLHDLTEERRNIEQLKLARKVFDTANEGILITRPDMDEHIVDVNEAFCRLTGRTREDLIGMNGSALRSGEHPPEFYEAVGETLRTTGAWHGEMWQTRADGTSFPSWMSMALAKDGEERGGNIVGIFTDITEIREAESKLQFNATHDSLTQLPNRLLLDDRLEHALAHARRTDGGLAVLFIDLDNFKDVNDTLGHAQGDALLVEAARRITAVLRESDTIGRFGGDEFAAVIAEVDDPVQVETTARRLLDTISSSYRLGAKEAHISASIGIALFPADGLDAASLIQHADIAMYGAKELGRNGVQFFSERLQATLNRRRAVEQELWGALEERRYFLLYQPQVNLSTGKITGVEALVRLRARDGTILSPTEFIPIAENSELIVHLGDWVLRTAFAELAAFQAITPDLVMGVNFSMRNFEEMDVTALLNSALEASDVKPQSVNLGITETAFLADPKEAAAKAEKLRDMVGVGLSLDDFGAGYSSLTYVRMFRANTIKIDTSFVQLLPDDPEARSVVLAIIALAKSLGATVVAEGPETEEQVCFLRANGCGVAQGLYFSGPVPADEIALLLRKGPFRLPVVQ